LAGVVWGCAIFSRAFSRSLAFTRAPLHTPLAPSRAFTLSRPLAPSRALSLSRAFSFVLLRSLTPLHSLALSHVRSFPLAFTYFRSLSFSFSRSALSLFLACSLSLFLSLTRAHTLSAQGGSAQGSIAGDGCRIDPGGARIAR